MKSIYIEIYRDIVYLQETPRPALLLGLAELSADSNNQHLNTYIPLQTT